MNGTGLTYTHLLLIGAAVGLILGLIDLFFAFKKGRKSLGVAAFFVCLFLGTASPVLGFLAFVIFLIVILVKGNAVTTDAADAETVANTEGTE